MIKFKPSYKDVIERPLYVAVDFDDTLCSGSGASVNIKNGPVAPIVTLIHVMHSRGWKTILWTCRGGASLQRAIKWCKRHHVPIDKHNKNDEATEWFEKRFKKEGEVFTWSAKIFADVYIDDSAISPFLLSVPEREVDHVNPLDMLRFIKHLEDACVARVVEHLKNRIDK